jgi:hypothetical protein
LKKTGVTTLPLHYGHAPSWLIVRMKTLSDAILQIIYKEQGAEVVLARLSDPFWFQAFGCALGFDWHSSGLTTVVCGVLKNILTVERHGVVAAGGKGAKALQAQNEISIIGERLSFSDTRTSSLQYASRISAKIDTAAVQCGYPIYHHAFYISQEGDWCVIQQGLNTQERLARRYHWLGETISSMVESPHSGITAPRIEMHMLDMTSKNSEENRIVSVDLAKGNPKNLVSSIRRLTESNTLDSWIGIENPQQQHPVLSMPRKLDWRIYQKIHDFQPSNYEELLSIKGVGPATVRALALVAQLIYGAQTSWNDPAKFSFAHGGKDGIPYPVARKTMDKSIKTLRNMIDGSDLPKGEAFGALKRLDRLSLLWGL